MLIKATQNNCKITYMNIGNRIRQRRKELKLTQEAVGKAMGINRVSVSQWESGDNKPKDLITLSKVLQCHAEWLLSGKENKYDNNAKWLGRIEPWDNGTALEDDEVELPFFTEVELSAGCGATQVQENHGPKLRFSKSTLKRHGVDPSHAACVSVSGNSMEPVLPDGSTIGVDISKTSIIDGKMYAIDHEGMLRVKSLYRMPGGIRLKSFNNDEYQDEIYTGEDAKNIRIIGKVFWYSVLI
jgi:phage repressor protein C with HTH and peptisase S24 domain